LLAAAVNPLCAILAGGNVILYACFYTTLKRMHWLNTWFGAIVGAIPPLIGWAAATGGMKVVLMWRKL
jgi:protoheme IX farnesyltransferase